MVISRAYRVSVEAEGVDARLAWEELVSQDPSIALSKAPQWIDCGRRIRLELGSIG